MNGDSEMKASTRKLDPVSAGLQVSEKAWFTMACLACGGIRASTFLAHVSALRNTRTELQLLKIPRNLEGSSA